MQDGTKDLVNKGTIYPFVKWKTPKLDKKGNPKIVKIKIVVGLPEPDHYSEKGNPVGQKKEEKFINAKIIRLQENTPPNPDVPNPEETSKGEDWVDSWFYQRPDYQTMTMDIENNNLKSYYIPSNYTKKDTNSWNSYEVEEIKTGKESYDYAWTTYTYTATLVLEPNIFPPHSTVRTQYWDNEKGWVMKSGYGIDQHTKAIMQIKKETKKDIVEQGEEYEEIVERDKPVDEEILKTTTNWTKAQGGVSFFSDFNLARGDNNKPKYWRILEACDTWDETPWNENDKLTDVNDDKINTNILQFKKNRFSTYNNRTHFTPLWYADDERYWVTTYVYDAWTPVGMLTNDTYSNMDGKSWQYRKDMMNKMSVYIKGNLYDDWYVQVLPDDYEIDGHKYRFQNQ